MVFKKFLLIFLVAALAGSGSAVGGLLSLWRASVEGFRVGAGLKRSLSEAEKTTGETAGEVDEKIEGTIEGCLCAAFCVGGAMLLASLMFLLDFVLPPLLVATKLGVAAVILNEAMKFKDSCIMWTVCLSVGNEGFPEAYCSCLARI